MEIMQYNLKLDEKMHSILEVEKKFEYDEMHFNKPVKIVKLMNDCLQLNKLAEEFFFVIGFTYNMLPLGIFEISHGTVTFSICNAREIFIRLLLVGATSFVAIHNHPSGGLKISEDDINTTKKLKKVSDLIGIQFADHIVIGNYSYVSIREMQDDVF